MIYPARKICEKELCRENTEECPVRLQKIHGIAGSDNYEQTKRDHQGWAGEFFADRQWSETGPEALLSAAERLSI